ncbi:MAG TPA: flagellar hook-basal body protein [bacterium]|nr:flagellar hook-basal body protein [bacterium]
MIRGLYMAGGALLQQAYDLEVTANNVANLNTVGFKADKTSYRTFQEVLLGRTNENRPAPAVGNFLRGSGEIQAPYIDFGQGVLTATGNPLDLAIRGPGFFTIQQADGSLGYTRAGNLVLDDTRTLITTAGQSVLDDQGLPVTVPDNGALQVDPRGQLTVAGQPVARLGLVNFIDPAQLEKLGGNTFRDKGGAGPVPVAGNTMVQQGFLERSNVSALGSMAQLTIVLRSFEASQKVVTMMDETLRQAAADLGRSQ